MIWPVLLAWMAGFAVGNLPDHSIVWVAIKLVFVVAAFVAVVVMARRVAT